jgi:hypothetical protein
MIPFGPWSEESVMNAVPSSPRRRSKRTSFRYVVGSATSVGKTMVRTTSSVVRSTHTSFGPPCSVGRNIGLPVSRIHSRSAGSTTTLCTDTSRSASASDRFSLSSCDG